VGFELRIGTSSGTLELQWLSPKAEIEDRNVLVVDDILDTGRTLDLIRRELGRLGAREVRTCVFLDNPSDGSSRSSRPAGFSSTTCSWSATARLAGRYRTPLRRRPACEILEGFDGRAPGS